MQVSVESPNKLERRMTIVVPIEKWDEAFDLRLKKLAKSAKIKGFRPGHVPLTHVKKMYGDAARQEALSDVIQSSLNNAFNQEKIYPVGTPTIEPKSIVPGQPLEFVAIFEVLPEVETVQFSLANIEKEVASITEDDINKVIDRLCEQHTEWKKVDRPAQNKDQVVIDFRGSIDGKVFAGGEAHDYPVILGSKNMIPGFEEGIIGMTSGQEKTIQVTFPENYHSKELAGKVAEFAIQAHRISGPVLPEMNSDLIKRFGIKSGELNDLRHEIKQNLEREVGRVVGNKLKAKVFDALIEQNSLEVPKALIAQEANRIHHELHPHHKEDDHGHTEEEMAAFNQAAKRNVVLGLLIGAYIRQQKLKPDANRVQEHLTKLAAAYEKPKEVITWYNSDKNRMAEIESYVLEEQVIEKLLEGITITEKNLNYQEVINT